jgi:predicted patatin/cPLA2 family phospholipase
MNKLNFYILSFTFLFLFIAGCSNDRILDKDKFVKVYTDLVIAHDTIPQKTANFDSVKQAVFNKYGITSGQYDSTVNYYNKDVERWQSFFKAATAYIDTLRKKNPK